MKKKGITVDNLSGVWLEKFTANDFIMRLKEIIKSPATDGYWIYTQMRMSKNCYWREHPEDPYTIASLAEIPYHNYIDASNDPASASNFFSRLKQLNNEIDDLRSGWGFRINKMLTSFFK